jgi:hypothetical protein
MHFGEVLAIIAAVMALIGMGAFICGALGTAFTCVALAVVITGAGTVFISQQDDPSYLQCGIRYTYYAIQLTPEQECQIAENAEKTSVIQSLSIDKHVEPPTAVITLYVKSSVGVDQIMESYNRSLSFKMYETRYAAIAAYCKSVGGQWFDKLEECILCPN